MSLPNAPVFHLLAVHVIDGDKGGFPAPWSGVRSARRQGRVNAVAHGMDGLPHGLGVGAGVERGSSRMRVTLMVWPNATSHLSTAPVMGAALWGSGEQARGMLPLTGKQSRGGVHPHPAGTGQVHLGPGVQVGEVGLRAGRAVQGFDVRRQLDQVPGHKACGQSQNGAEC